MLRLGILISGGGSNMVSLVKAATQSQHVDPVLVVSNVPGAGGLAKADALGVKTQTVNHREFATRHDFENQLAEVLIDQDLDLICLAGFMRILTQEFVAKFEGKMLNIHPSLLPKYPGLHTHQRALDAGDTLHGCTVHEVIPVLDAGPMLGQAEVPVLAGDTAETLASRVLQVEHILYPQVILGLEEARQNPIFLKKSFI